MFRQIAVSHGDLEDSSVSLFKKRVPNLAGLFHRAVLSLGNI